MHKLWHIFRNILLISLSIYLIIIVYDQSGLLGTELLGIFALLLLIAIGISTIISKLTTIINELKH